MAELERLDPTLFVQVRVSRMLGLGFALTLWWVCGIGSLVALVIGVRARRIIRDSGGAVAGKRMAWWCIAAGAAGALAGLPYMVWLFIEAAKNR